MIIIRVRSIRCLLRLKDRTRINKASVFEVNPLFKMRLALYDHLICWRSMRLSRVLVKCTALRRWHSRIHQCWDRNNILCTFLISNFYVCWHLLCVVCLMLRCNLITSLPVYLERLVVCGSYGASLLRLGKRWRRNIWIEADCAAASTPSILWFGAVHNFFEQRFSLRLVRIFLQSLFNQILLMLTDYQTV